MHGELEKIYFRPNVHMEYSYWNETSDETAVDRYIDDHIPLEETCFLTLNLVQGHPTIKYKEMYQKQLFFIYIQW